MYQPILAKIIINGKELAIIYNKEEKGLHYMKSDDDVEKVILTHTDEIFNYAINEIDNNKFILNIASTEDFGDFDWNGDIWSDNLLKKQLIIYMPLIQKFIADAMTGTL